MSNGVKLFISTADNSLLSKARVQELIEDFFNEKIIDRPWAILEEGDINLDNPREMVAANFEADHRGEDRESLIEALDAVDPGDQSLVLWFSGLNWDNYRIQAPLERQGYFNGNLFIVLLKEPRLIQMDDGEQTLQHFVMLQGNRTAEELDGTPLPFIFGRYFGDDFITNTQHYEVKPVR
jgi:hypothetical protein